MNNLINNQMRKKTMKPVYNYNLEQCNRLFKKGVHPIGVGVNDKTGNVFHVFKGERYYFDMLSAVLYEMEQEVRNTECMDAPQNIKSE